MSGGEFSDQTNDGSTWTVLEFWWCWKTRKYPHSWCERHIVVERDPYRNWWWRCNQSHSLKTSGNYTYSDKRKTWKKRKCRWKIFKWLIFRMLKGLNILLGSKIFQKVNILHFQLEVGRGKKLYFLFSCDNILPSKAVTRMFDEYKGTEITYLPIRPCWIL